jgi:hypothetical protein
MGGWNNWKTEKIKRKSESRKGELNERKEREGKEEGWRDHLRGAG